MAQHLEDGFPIIEQFDRQCPGLPMAMAEMTQTSALQRGQAVGVVGGEIDYRASRGHLPCGIDVGHQDFEGGAHLMAKALAVAVVALHQPLSLTRKMHPAEQTLQR